MLSSCRRGPVERKCTDPRALHFDGRACPACQLRYGPRARRRPLRVRSWATAGLSQAREVLAMTKSGQSRRHGAPCRDREAAAPLERGRGGGYVSEPRTAPRSQRRFAPASRAFRELAQSPMSEQRPRRHARLFRSCWGWTRENCAYEKGKTMQAFLRSGLNQISDDQLHTKLTLYY